MAGVGARRAVQGGPAIGRWQRGRRVAAQRGAPGCGAHCAARREGAHVTAAHWRGAGVEASMPWPAGTGAAARCSSCAVSYCGEAREGAGEGPGEPGCGRAVRAWAPLVSAPRTPSCCALHWACPRAAGPPSQPSRPQGRGAAHLGDELARALHRQEDAGVDGDGAVHGGAKAAEQPRVPLHRHALAQAVQGAAVLRVGQAVALHLALDAAWAGGGWGGQARG